MTRLPAEEDTLALGRRLARRLKGGTVVCLHGELGAGKTTLVRGILRGLGYKGQVTSPTFALVNEYPRLKPRVYHLDLYRVEAEDLENLALEEYLGDPKAACLVEWPEVAGKLLPRRRIEIRLSHGPGAGRSARLKGVRL